ncbi:hypothetical protein ACJX0J_026117, partial [Zea mays]
TISAHINIQHHLDHLDHKTNAQNISIVDEVTSYFYNTIRCVRGVIDGALAAVVATPQHIYSDLFTLILSLDFLTDKNIDFG